ncbi:CRISPR-associated protein [Aeropyrum camini SY1 = JCM 12091]|uniref:CRISPR-associated protein n=1 Tax=Aeropyrum camini SY1 = JCM 12091 TaxID=1198449 RepID=U3TDZ0_9CREN|nr:CRISPR-associated protein [Aeropyrum camini SY1 = JCM 12091]
MGKKRRARMPIAEENGSSSDTVRPGDWVVVAELATPAFSVKNPEAYQVASPLPLPLPSTLLGGLMRGVSLLDSCTGGIASQSCIEKTGMMVKAAAPLSKPGQILGVEWEVVLRRLRKVLEPDSEKCSKKKNAGKRSNRALDELREMSDALLRGYITPYNPVYAVFVARNRDDINKIEKAIWYIDRLGDSESLVSARPVGRCQLAEVRSRSVNTPVALDSAVGGSFTVVYAPARADGTGGTRRIEAIAIAMPVKREAVERGYVIVYSEIEVEGSVYGCSVEGIEGRINVAVHESFHEVSGYGIWMPA